MGKGPSRRLSWLLGEQRLGLPSDTQGSSKREMFSKLGAGKSRMSDH